ncbi:protein transport protein Sec31A isoform X2 [Nerophis lumbriciformis]|uniref:protein transport protein Sec31A isoform X2 n=1 Tax=Nerophis lumbriciformis TaxID=546530 RepID=UPI002AE06318|nr:protein transport protein Sec31A-like isoform X2 [Nerophis lumbriciformis]
MKLKEINRTAIQCWSPAQHHPIYLATGTSAQQLDASFSTSASLEIFELDLSDPSLDMKSCGSFSSSHRYHKLVWASFGTDSQDHPAGVVIAGGENGNVILYDAAKVVGGESDVVGAESDRHTGPVRALDVNPFQANLFASAGNESEIYIWDINNFTSPMTPGPKNQPVEDISCVSWNKQVQHILASASPSGRASVWDLRKNDLIIKVSDHSNRMHCSGLAWNPEVATQLVLASEDDRMPVIQMWDLRFATSPLKILENHTRGILAIAWSLADPELLLSCGKDSRILCWNPGTAEVVYELPTGSQWCFDVQWCPRNPAVLSAACFDGRIGVYSVMGGSSRHVEQMTNSLANMDPFGTGQTLPPLQLPQSAAPPASVNPLKKPPKWIRRPVGASFAFGGKLVSLENNTAADSQQGSARVVHVSQVVTETAFLERSQRLQDTLTAGGFQDFCQEKILAAENDLDKTVWSFLKANFESDVRSKFLELLGYNKEELAAKISAALEGKPADALTEDVCATASVQPPPPPPDNPEAAFDLIAASNLQTGEDSAADGLDEDVAPQEEGEEIALEEDVPLEEEESSPATTPAQAEEPPAGGVSLGISQDVDGLITQALLTGDFEAAVELCLHDNRMADSIILAIAGGAELLEKTQRKYFRKTHSKITKLISAVVMKDWHDVLKTCDLHNWREALAAIMTYAQPEEFSSLCDLLGARLEAADEAQLQANACLCYICAGNMDKLLSCWTAALERHCPLSLQGLVEKVVVLRRAVEQTQRSGPAAIGVLLAETMGHYAGLLASQGSLSTAMAYLPDNTDQVAVRQLRQRLTQALGQQKVAAAATAPLQTHNTPSSRGAAQHRHPFTPVQPHATPAPPVPAPTSVPPQQQYYQPVRPASTVTSWSNQTPTALPSAPHPLQVEPPKPVYGMAGAYMSSQQYQPPPQVEHYTPGAYQPLHYSSSPPPPPGFLSHYTQPAPPPSLPSPTSSQPPFFPSPSSHYTQPAPPPSLPSPTSSHPPFSPSSSSFPPQHPLSSCGASFQHGVPGSPGSYAPPPLPGGVSGPQNGWNDPPNLSRSSKKKMSENFTPPVPITAPIMRPLGADPQAQPVAPQGPAAGLHGYQAPYSGVQQTSPANPSLPKTSTEGAPGAPTGDAMQVRSKPGIYGERVLTPPRPPQTLPAEKILKKPIPDEHLVLKTTFEGLIQKCLAVATDPQTRRKLDDANKRLEALYDKLREQSLSPAIVGGLHDMARSVASRSYGEGLNIHTHIVGSSNFSETSAFMPVLKVVLTQANKLGV